MKKSILILILLLIEILLPVQMTAQGDNENKGKFSLSEKSIDLSGDKIKPQLSDSTSLSALLFSEQLKPSLFSESYASMLKFNPALSNYNISGITKLSDHISLIPFNQQVTYFGLGRYNNIGASLLWAPSNKLSLEASLFLSRQFGYVLSSQYVVYGTNLMLNYNLMDKLQFRIWGQYITPGVRDPFLNQSDLFPKTKIGADLQYKSSEKTKIGIGVEYEHERQDNTWKSKSGGKVSVGF